METRNCGEDCELKKPLTKGDFRLWTISVEKFAVVLAAGILVFGPGLIAIGKSVVCIYEETYGKAFEWLAVLAFCALFYWPIHWWYYSLDREQRSIRDRMSK